MPRFHRSVRYCKKLAISIIIACLAVNNQPRCRETAEKRCVKDGSEMQTLGVLVRKITYITAVVIILVVVFELGSNFGTVLGIPQSPAWPSREVMARCAGYLNIITGSIFRIGDRIRMSNVVGDVLYSTSACCERPSWR